jgi:hypothetical protein
MAEIPAYRRRAHAFEGEATWRAEPDALVWTCGDRRWTLPWREVTSLRVRFAPTRLKPGRRLCTLKGEGRRIEFDNQHFVGIGEFETRDEAWSAFVRAIAARVAAASPQASAYLGAGPGNYLGSALTLGLGPALLAWVLLTLPLPEGDTRWLVTVKLALVAAMLPTALVWLVRSRPRRTSLDAIAAGELG